MAVYAKSAMVDGTFLLTSQHCQTKINNIPAVRMRPAPLLLLGGSPSIELTFSPVCDSYVRPMTLVKICDECSFGQSAGKCIICSSNAISDAYYCTECTRLEKDRDGCPKIINMGASRVDAFYERKKLG